MCNSRSWSNWKNDDSIYDYVTAWELGEKVIYPTVKIACKHVVYCPFWVTKKELDQLGLNRNSRQINFTKKFDQKRPKKPVKSKNSRQMLGKLSGAEYLNDQYGIVFFWCLMVDFLVHLLSSLDTLVQLGHLK